MYLHQEGGTAWIDTTLTQSSWWEEASQLLLVSTETGGRCGSADVCGPQRGNLYAVRAFLAAGGDALPLFFPPFLLPWLFAVACFFC